MSANRINLKQQIEDWFAVHENEMLDDLCKLLSINSVKSEALPNAPYGAGSRAALDLTASMLRERGFEVDIFEDIILTADIGASDPYMGILAHVDVVGVGDGWDSDPFEMTIKDGKIIGRGATDNKGPSIAAMYAMFCANELCPELRSGFQILIGSGEEVGCEDIAQYLEKSAPPPNVFTPDADYPIVNTEKGRLTPFFSASWEKDETLPRVVSIIGGSTTNIVPDSAEAVIEGFAIGDAENYCREFSEKAGIPITVQNKDGLLAITAEGVSSHAARPHSGSNAQTALLELLAGMPFAKSAGFGYICALNRLFPFGDNNGRALGIAMSDELSGELTLNFGVLRFSQIDFAGNFDSRTPICADETDLLGMVRSAFEREGITMSTYKIANAHHTPEDSLFVKTLLRIYEEYTGNAGECLAVGGQTYVHDIPGGVAFGCEMPGISNRIHGVNEFIGVEQLIVSAKMFARAILEMCNGA